MLIKRLLFAVLLVLMALPVVSYAQDADDESAPDLFIGTITDEPDIFVGLSLDGDEAVLYICDGQPDKGTISVAQWFVGTVADNALDITSAKGDRVTLTLTEDSATGQFTFSDGSVKAFVLNLSEDGALFRSEFAFGDDAYVGGWLVLEDGSVRGSFIKKLDNSFAPASLASIGVIAVGKTADKKEEG